MRLVWALAVLLALAPAVCTAQGNGEEPAEQRGDSDAARSLRFPGSLGLTGMQDMVDARVPSLVSLRGVVQYDLALSDRDLVSDVEVSQQREQHAFTFAGGASALGLFDAAIRVPWSTTHVRDQPKGLPDPAGENRRGWGNVEVSAKLALDLGPLVLSPYLFGRLPTGEPEVRDLGRFEYGLAGTVSLLNEYVAVHANVVGLQEEGGLSAFRYRLGGSLVVYSEPDLLVRVYAYQDGVEFEGKADSDIDLELGAQALLLQIVTIEVGGSFRLHDGGYIDDRTRDGFEAIGLSEAPDFESGSAWGLRLAIGLAF